MVRSSGLVEWLHGHLKCKLPLSFCFATFTMQFHSPSYGCNMASVAPAVTCILQLERKQKRKAKRSSFQLNQTSASPGHYTQLITYCPSLIAKEDRKHFYQDTFLCQIYVGFVSKDEEEWALCRHLAISATVSLIISFTHSYLLLLAFNLILTLPLLLLYLPDICLPSHLFSNFLCHFI